VAGLISVLIVHEVDDVDLWLASPLQVKLAARLGSEFRLYVDPFGTKLVAATVEVPSVDFITKHLNSPENQAAMQHDGVRLDTLRLLIAP